MKKTKLSFTSFWAGVTSAPLALWCVLFILAPLGFIVYYAFTDDFGGFTFSNISELFTDFNNLLVLKDSLIIAFESTLICLIIAYPLAYFISRMSKRAQSIMSVLIMLPMWVNLIIRTYSLIYIFDKNGLINNFLSFIGLSKVSFLNSNITIIIGMVYNFLPYMVLPIYSVMTKIDKSLIEASNDLGCNPFKTVIKVIFPLSISGIISGITMVFVPSISTFYISSALSSGRIVLIGDVIESNFLKNNAFNTGSAISLVLMILIIISMLVMNKLGGDDGGAVV